MKATVGDILEALGRLAPWDLAADWDNSGLQAGDRRQEVERVLVSLDAGEEEVAGALERRAQLLVTHHPLLFSPLRQIDTGQPAGALLGRILRHDLAVVAAHTNLDAAPGGLADDLARKLGLGKIRPLHPADSPGYRKVVVYVPEEHLAPVARALREAGAGEIGAHYEGCLFSVTGIGSFTPLPGAHPFIGVPGKREEVREARLETRVPARLAGAVVEAVRRAHPYEEPAVDVYPLEGGEEGAGFGRLGDLETTPRELLEKLKSILGRDLLRTVGSPPGRIGTAAVLPGSGGDYVRRAREKGADVFITGELKYHQALEARSLGLWVIEGGHRETEAGAVPLLAGFLRREDQRMGWNLTIEEQRPTGDLFDRA